MGAGMQGLFFCHRTSCRLDEALSSGCGYRVQAHSEAKLEVRLLPGPCLFRGSSGLNNGSEQSP